MACGSIFDFAFLTVEWSARQEVLLSARNRCIGLGCKHSETNRHEQQKAEKAYTKKLRIIISKSDIFTNSNDNCFLLEIQLTNNSEESRPGVRLERLLCTSLQLSRKSEPNWTKTASYM